MLKTHLKAHAESVDETRYVVTLRDNAALSANSAFVEHEEDLGDSAAQYWARYYESRLRFLGVQLPPNARVLDCACGIGRLGRAAAERYGASSVAFCDLSMSQVRQAAERSSEELSGHAWAQVGDLCRLPFADAVFDAVVGNSFLHHLPDVPAAVREMRRVCRPGGYVIILHEPSVYAPFWESFPVSLYKNMYRHTDTSNFTDLWCFSADRLKDVFTEAGFTDVRITGRGVLPSLAVNPLLLIARKLGKHLDGKIVGLHRLRVRLDELEAALARKGRTPTAPSLVIVARTP